jgi:DNA-binding NtrC family response regulator
LSAEFDYPDSTVDRKFHPTWPGDDLKQCARPPASILKERWTDQSRYHAGRTWQRGYIEAAHRTERGNMSQAARRLGINRTTLYNRMESWQRHEPLSRTLRPA